MTGFEWLQVMLLMSADLVPCPTLNFFQLYGAEQELREFWNIST